MKTTLEVEPENNEPQEVAQTRKKVNELVTITTNFVVRTDAELSLADQFLLRIKDELTAIGRDHDPLCASAYETWTRATTLRKALTDPLKVAEVVVKQARGAYIVFLENKRQQEEKEANEKAAAEEAQRQAEWQIEQDRIKKESDEKKLELAAKLEAEGKTELAEHVLETPAPPPPPPPPPAPRAYVPLPAPPKTAGISTRDNFKARIPINPKEYQGALLALVKACAADPDRYLHYLKLDESALHAFAKSTKGVGKLPGIEMFNDPITSTSTRRA